MAIRDLISKLYRGLISRREFSRRLSLMGFGLATSESILSSVEPASGAEGEHIGWARSRYGTAGTGSTTRTRIRRCVPCSRRS
jgi:hypothetical protein